MFGSTAQNLNTLHAIVGGSICLLSSSSEGVFCFLCASWCLSFVVIRTVWQLWEGLEYF